MAASTWSRRTRRRAAEAWARRRRDWRRWKSARRIESPSSSGLISRVLSVFDTDERKKMGLKTSVNTGGVVGGDAAKADMNAVQHHKNFHLEPVDEIHISAAGHKNYHIRVTNADHARDLKTGRASIVSKENASMKADARDETKCSGDFLKRTKIYSRKMAAA